MINIRTIIVAQLFLFVLMTVPLAQACTTESPITFSSRIMFSSGDVSSCGEIAEEDLPSVMLGQKEDDAYDTYDAYHDDLPDDFEEGVPLQALERNGYYEVDIENGGYYNFE